ncbi:MAG: hypothetical protein KBC64_08055, partial [Simkaniaceae bacterium]|nr:hypothetical protein [Simkaniaceae bacterium]
MRLTSLALADRSQRWWYLSSIQLAGGVISLPVIGIGSHLALSYGLATAITSILIGNLFVLFISYLMIAMSFPRRLNAVENAKQYIGVAGSKIFAVFILTSALGWSGWILLSGAHLLHKHPFFSTLATGSLVGGIASFVLLIGIKGLKNLALFTVIPLLGLLAFLISDGMSEMAILPKSSHLLSLPAIALAISPSIGAIMDYPTFFRHSKTTKDAYIAIGVIFVITCIVEMAGFMLLNSHLDPNQHQLLTFFVILSMITGACWNIYAASVGWES